MSKNKPDIKAVIDRGESVSMMEPMLIAEQSVYRSDLSELATELAEHSTGFRQSLPDGIIASLADLVRAMNCYYSNLIEGHDTHPIDIERALNNDYSTNSKKRNLQLEAKAHIEVQQWIDSGGLLGHSTTKDGICGIHERFSAHLPDDLLWVEDVDGSNRVKVIPGEFRRGDVKVGLHVPISPGAVDRFLDKFETVYTSLAKVKAILAAAAAHHRLLWIHPFLDGNGRVARLMSHAMLLEALDTRGIWSIARGLARNEATYKNHFMECDLPRRNDLDGRGNLTEEGLVSFTKFFLEACIDQVKFMEALIQPERMRARVLLWAEEEARLGILPSKAGKILEVLLYKGELQRREVATILDVQDRQSRRIMSTLVEQGIVVSDNARAPWRLVFPAKLASRWLPGLFPEK